jgi:sortase A
MKKLSAILAICGAAAIGYWAFASLRTLVYQQREKQRFATKPVRPEPPLAGRQTQSEDSAPAPRPAIGSPVGLLEIRRLGLSAVIVEGAGHRELDFGPGHMPQTPLPGEGGNIGVAGHRDSVFRPLRLIRAGDTIRVVSNDREYEYEVTSIEIVGPKDVRVLSPARRETLTLITCYPFFYVGSAPKRYIVHAERIDVEEAAKQPSAMSPQ